MFLNNDHPIIRNFQVNLSSKFQNFDEKPRGEAAKKERKKKNMSLDGGLSWADQWDNNPDPPPPSSSENEKNKNKNGSSDKSKFRKTILSFKWMKELRKKSDKS